MMEDRFWYRNPRCGRRAGRAGMQYMAKTKPPGRACWLCLVAPAGCAWSCLVVPATPKKLPPAKNPTATATFDVCPPPEIHLDFAHYEANGQTAILISHSSSLRRLRILENLIQLTAKDTRVVQRLIESFHDHVVAVVSPSPFTDFSQSDIAAFLLRFSSGLAFSYSN
jgi:hypothetical protein